MSPTNQLETVGGRYRLRERIGHGGMGEVFVAHDARLDREVALKLLRADLAGQPGMRERVLAEARLTARLTHPNVVAVLDTGEEDGRPYVVMERLSGRTLRDELDRGPMPAERVRDVGLHVLRALSAAHALGIVHRDVKPGNVLDAGVGTWKVADFGIAKWVHADDTLTGTGELLGSPAYVAPERIDGTEADQRSDLYSVGVLLYEALSGRKPFSMTEPIALAERIREGRYDPVGRVLPDADPVIAGVIERAMRREPDERFRDADEMAAALGDDSAGDPTVAMPVGANERPADAAETTALPPLERTARLPVPAAAEPNGTDEGDVGRRRASRRARTPRRRMGIVVAGAAIAIALLTVLAIAAFTGAGRDRTQRERGPALPAQLEEALRRLEGAVRP
jgi:eukaryotic-like serine/threonine-protein kinase